MSKILRFNSRLVCARNIYFYLVYLNGIYFQHHRIINTLKGKLKQDYLKISP